MTDDEKKKRQFEAARTFGKALHDLRCEGVRQEYRQDGVTDKVFLIDRETNKRIAEFAFSEMLMDVGGQIVEDYVVSGDYFGDLVKDRSLIEAMD